MKDDSVPGTEVTAPLVARTPDSLKIVSLTTHVLHVPIVRDLSQELNPINQKLFSLCNKVNADEGKRYL